MKSILLKQAATCGLYIGLALIVVSLLDYLFGFYGQNKVFNLISYVIMIVGIAWATIWYRDKDLGGFVTYGQAVSFGVVLSACFGIVSAVFVILLTTVIAPEYMERALEITYDKLLEKGTISEDQADAMIAMSKKLANPIFTFFTSILGSVIMGLVISLISSIFIKKNPPVTSDIN